MGSPHQVPRGHSTLKERWESCVLSGAAGILSGADSHGATVHPCMSARWDRQAEPGSDTCSATRNKTACVGSASQGQAGTSPKCKGSYALTPPPEEPFHCHSSTTALTPSTLSDTWQQGLGYLADLCFVRTREMSQGLFLFESFILQVKMTSCGLEISTEGWTLTRKPKARSFEVADYERKTFPHGA